MLSNATYRASNLPDLLSVANTLGVTYDENSTAAMVVLSIWYLISTGRYAGNLTRIGQLPAEALDEVTWLDNTVARINLAIEVVGTQQPAP